MQKKPETRVECLWLVQYSLLDAPEFTSSVLWIRVAQSLVFYR